MVTPGMRPAGWTWFVLFGVFLTANAHFLSGRAYIPYDSTDQFFPQTLFVVRSLLRGDAPWWNPLVFSGIPVLGDPQSMIFTPHTLIGLLAGHSFGQMTFDLTTLSCLLVGAGALLVYGRRIGGTPAVGLLGAVLFMLGGVATSRLQHVIQCYILCNLAGRASGGAEPMSASRRGSSLSADDDEPDIGAQPQSGRLFEHFCDWTAGHTACVTVCPPTCGSILLHFSGRSGCPAVLADVFRRQRNHWLVHSEWDVYRRICCVLVSNIQPAKLVSSRSVWRSEPSICELDADRPDAGLPLYRYRT